LKKPYTITNIKITRQYVFPTNVKSTVLLCSKIWGLHYGQMGCFWILCVYNVWSPFSVNSTVKRGFLGLKFVSNGALLIWLLDAVFFKVAHCCYCMWLVLIIH